MTSPPHLSWPDFLERFDWRQGEHLTLIGATGSGKTTLALELLRRANRSHPWRVIFRTKRRDPVLEQLRREGYVTIGDWTVSDPDVTPRVIYHPPLRQGVESLGEQREGFRRALRSIFLQGGWLLYLDELRYVTDYLKLAPDVELLIQQGRSLGVSVVAGVQRPRHVPLVTYDQAGHLILFRTQDQSMRDRLAELAGRADPELVRSAIGSLESHQMLYVNPLTGDVLKTQAEVP